MPRPGCVLRSALVMFGILFLPMSVWFAYVSWRRNWGNALALFSISMLFFRLGLSRDDDSWISSIDDLHNDSR
jgi:hypothetical protein